MKENKTPRTPKLKKGTVRAFTVTVTCPHCKMEATEPNTGSYYWALDEMTVGQTVECDCGEMFGL